MTTFILVSLYRKPCKYALNTSTCVLVGLLRYLVILSWNSHAPTPHPCNSGIESHDDLPLALMIQKTL